MNRWLGFQNPYDPRDPIFFRIEEMTNTSALLLHPWKLTWNLKSPHWRGKSSSKSLFWGSMLIFGGVREPFFLGEDGLQWGLFWFKQPYEVVKKLQELLHDLFFVIVFFLPYRFTGDCDYSNKYNRFKVLQTLSVGEGGSKAGGDSGAVGGSGKGSFAAQRCRGQVLEKRTFFAKTLSFWLSFCYRLGYLFPTFFCMLKLRCSVTRRG